MHSDPISRIPPRLNLAGSLGNNIDLNIRESLDELEMAVTCIETSACRECAEMPNHVRPCHCLYDTFASMFLHVLKIIFVSRTIVSVEAQTKWEIAM